MVLSLLSAHGIIPLRVEAGFSSSTVRSGNFFTDVPSVSFPWRHPPHWQLILTTIVKVPAFMPDGPHGPKEEPLARWGSTHL